jgi:hypothetical protein
LSRCDTPARAVAGGTGQARRTLGNAVAPLNAALLLAGARSPTIEGYSTSCKKLKCTRMCVEVTKLLAGFIVHGQYLAARFPKPMLPA